MANDTENKLVYWDSHDTLSSNAEENQWGLPMEVLAASGRVLQINAPEWFGTPAFVEMIDRANGRVATFHEQGTPPSEYSDVFLPFDTFRVGVDSIGNEIWHGDGSDIFHIDDLNSMASDIVQLARNCGIQSGIAWICNLP